MSTDTQQTAKAQPPRYSALTFAKTSGWLAVSFGLAAAVLWSLSASVKSLTVPGATIGFTSPNDPFNTAVSKAVLELTGRAGGIDVRSIHRI